MRASLPARSWREPVAAIQGIVLTVAAAEILPHPEMGLAIVVAGACLANRSGEICGGCGATGSPGETGSPRPKPRLQEILVPGPR